MGCRLGFAALARGLNSKALSSHGWSCASVKIPSGFTKTNPRSGLPVKSMGWQPGNFKDSS